MKEGWTYKKLGDCLSYIKNGANIKQLKNAGGFPITRIETLSGGIFNRDRLGYADIFELGRFAPYVLDDGDILMSHINSKTHIGRAVLYQKNKGESIIHGMNLLRMKTIPDSLCSPYATYVFRSSNFKDEIAKVRKDAVNQSSVSISDIRRIQIPLPPLSEQQHIVDELDLLSSIIEKKKEQLKELDNLAESIFYDMFGDPVMNEKGWEERKLGEICHKIVNINWGNVNKEDVLSYIDLSAVDRESRNITSTMTITKANAPSRAKQIVNIGDVLFGTTRPMLKRVCAISEKNDKNICSTGFCVLRPDKNKANTEWVTHLILSDQFYNYIEPLQSGASYPAVSDKIVLSYSIPLPPLSLQQQFASKIEAIEKQKEFIKQSIKETETLFNSRMDYYFN